MAILSNILINVKIDIIEFTGTDLEIQLVAISKANVQQEGKVTVPGRKLLDICKLLPDTSSIRIELTGDKLNLNSGRSRFKLSTLDANEYPDFSAGNYLYELSINSIKFKTLLKKTSYCMANQDVRYFLNGLLLQVTGTNITGVASDGHRLSLYREKLETKISGDIELILPRKGVLELIRILEVLDENIILKISSNTMEISCSNILFSSKLIDGKFPDFKNVFDQNISRSFSFDTKIIKAILARVSVLSNEILRSISLKFSKNVLKITSNNTEQEEAYEEIDIDFEGENFEVAFNSGYLVDAINNINSNDVSLSFTDITNICFIEDKVDKNLKFVVMPMRL